MRFTLLICCLFDSSYCEFVWGGVLPNLVVYFVLTFLRCCFLLGRQFGFEFEYVHIVRLIMLFTFIVLVMGCFGFLGFTVKLLGFVYLFLVVCGLLVLFEYLGWLYELFSCFIVFILVLSWVGIVVVSWCIVFGVCCIVLLGLFTCVSLGCLFGLYGFCFVAVVFV